MQKQSSKLMDELHQFLCLSFMLLMLCCISGCTMTKTKYGSYISEGLERKSLTDKEVLRAMSRVPRHKFVAENFSDLAYEDRALPIGEGQTISQPYVVALMTQEAKVGLGSKVLEIGTGSGFQAAVLSELGAKVFSIEIVPSLAEIAKERLSTLGYDSVSIKVGDGWQGWPEEAPFDAILITAAAPTPPSHLLAQLANRGKMIVPIEEENGDGETLMLIERNGDDFVTKSLGSVKFVPITGEAREKN
jgi:protein-L-isoaspartate(D-aspartate) O-methyltransferase